LNSQNAISIVVFIDTRDSVKKSCGGSGSQQLVEQLKEELKKRKLEILVREQICFGRCNDGIVMRIAPGKEFFTEVNTETLAEIIRLAEYYSLQNNKAFLRSEGLIE
jgi:predicted metal-binding protein